MNRVRTALCGLAFLLAAGSAWAAPADKPEAVAQAYFSALQQNGLASAVEFLHPAELAKFKDMMQPVLAAEDGAGKRDLRDAMFGPSATLQDAASSSPAEFMRAFMKFVSARMGDVKPSFDKIDVLGSIQEGELVHVVTRLQIGVGELSVRQMEVISLKPSGDAWKVMLTGQIEGFARALRARVPAPRR